MPASIHAQYVVALIALCVALLLCAGVLMVGRLRGPAPRPASKNPAPEFGGRSDHKTWVQFRVRYAVLALLFVAFDMEMVFMFPWAVAFKPVGMVALLDMVVFIAILAAAIVFAWKAGAFDWER